MERITKEQSLGFIPVEEDYFRTPAYYFTLEEDGDGWDVVKYFTNRKRGIYSGKEGNEYVYILLNPSFPNLLKIGSTTKAPEDRAKVLSKGTGVPQEFEVIWVYTCFKAEKIEREVHKKLRKYRINNQREFFQIDLQTAIDSIETIGLKYIQ
jgi:hypothetical protein